MEGSVGWIYERSGNKTHRKCEKDEDLDKINIWKIENVQRHRTQVKQWKFH